MRPLKRSRYFAISLLFLFARSASADPPSLAFSSDEITVGGLTPDSEVVLFGVSRRRGDWITELEVQVDLLSADASGNLTELFNQQIPGGSLWSVIDVKTGNRAVNSPGGRALQERGVALSDLVKGGPFGSPSILSIDGRQKLELVVVRPNVGAWHGTFSDGGAGDSDQESDGTITIYAPDLNALQKGPRLQVFQLHDVIVGLDVGVLEFVNINLIAGQ